MFDAHLAAWIKPSIDGMAKRLASRGLQANHITLVGFVVGMIGAALIASTHYRTGLLFIAFSRLMDGLDGAVARATTSTDRGAFLDITLDFIFYASIPLAFAIAAPKQNALPAAVLLFAFMTTAASFLAYACIAAKRRNAPSPSKGLRYVGGLTEAFETFLCFSVMCWLPDHFALCAYIFAALCTITAITRIYAAWHDFD